MFKILRRILTTAITMMYAYCVIYINLILLADKDSCL